MAVVGPPPLELALEEYRKRRQQATPVPGAALPKAPVGATVPAQPAPGWTPGTAVSVGTVPTAPPMPPPEPEPATESLGVERVSLYERLALSPAWDTLDDVGRRAAVDEIANYDPRAARLPPNAKAAMVDELVRLLPAKVEALRSPNIFGIRVVEPTAPTPAKPGEDWWREKFNTPLTPDEEIAFQGWLKEESARQGRDLSMDLPTYDVRGFWKAGEKTDEAGHGTDRYKKPSHPTFSTDSIYSGPGLPGGKWDEDGTFHPSETNLRYALEDTGKYIEWAGEGRERLGAPARGARPPTALGVGRVEVPQIRTMAEAALPPQTQQLLGLQRGAEAERAAGVREHPYQAALMRGFAQAGTVWRGGEPGLGDRIMAERWADPIREAVPDKNILLDFPDAVREGRLDRWAQMALEQAPLSLSLMGVGLGLSTAIAASGGSMGVALLGGAGGSRFLESLMEGAGARQQAAEQGLDLRRQGEVARRVALNNMVYLTPLDLAELALWFTPIKALRVPVLSKLRGKVASPALQRVMLSAPARAANRTLAWVAANIALQPQLEGFEEYLQQAMVEEELDISDFWEPSPGKAEAQLGGQLGGLMFGAGSAVPAAVAGTGRLSFEKRIERALNRAMANYQAGVRPSGLEAPPPGPEREVPRIREQYRFEEAPSALAIDSKLRTAWARGEVSDEDAAAEIVKRGQITQEQALEALRGAGIAAERRLHPEYLPGQTPQEAPSRPIGEPGVSPAADTFEQLKIELGLEAGRAEARGTPEDLAEAASIRAAIPGVRVAPARTEYEQRVSQFGAEHGVEVVFFESPARLPLVGLSQRPGVVLVQRNQHPAAAVLGIMLHELGHDIRNRQPEAFDAVARWVEETRPDLWKFAGEDLEGYADLTPEKRREETLTYLLHENATAIVRAIANREELRAAGEPRGPAARVWEWIKDFLTKAVRALGVEWLNPRERGVLARIGRMPRMTAGDRKAAIEILTTMADLVESVRGAPRAEIMPGGRPGAPAAEAAAPAAARPLRVREGEARVAEAVPAEPAPVAAPAIPELLRELALTETAKTLEGAYRVARTAHRDRGHNYALVVVDAPDGFRVYSRRRGDSPWLAIREIKMADLTERTPTLEERTRVEAAGAVPVPPSSALAYRQPPRWTFQGEEPRVGAAPAPAYLEPPAEGERPAAEAIAVYAEAVPQETYERLRAMAARVDAAYAAGRLTKAERLDAALEAELDRLDAALEDALVEGEPGEAEGITELDRRSVDEELAQLWANYERDPQWWPGDALEESIRAILWHVEPGAEERTARLSSAELRDLAREAYEQRTATRGRLRAGPRAMYARQRGRAPAAEILPMGKAPGFPLALRERLAAEGELERFHMERGTHKVAGTVVLRETERQRIEEIAARRGLPVRDVSRALKVFLRQYPSNIDKPWRRPLIEDIGYNRKGEMIPKFPLQAWTFYQRRSGKQYGRETNREAGKLARRIVGEISDHAELARQGNHDSQVIIAQADWYTRANDEFQRIFGGAADLVMQALATTSPRVTVAQNYKIAMEVIQRFHRGDFDGQLRAFLRWLQENPTANRAHVPTGLRLMRVGQQLERAAEDETELAIAGDEDTGTGAQYGMEVVLASLQRALLNRWEKVGKNLAPKTRHFYRNLMGDLAVVTVDVWAARTLERLAGRDRLIPGLEPSVPGKFKADLTPGSGYGFGQTVFEIAADQLTEQNTIGRAVQPAEVQAMMWFAEKLIWLKNDYARGKAADGGVYGESLRPELPSRYVVGVSTEPAVPGEAGAPQVRARLEELLRADDGVVAWRAPLTMGVWDPDKPPEGSIDLELTARRTWDPAPLVRQIREEGQRYGQTSVFISRVLDPTEYTDRSTPALEVYFRESMKREDFLKLMAKLKQKFPQIEGATAINDVRTRLVEQDLIFGLRSIAIPEYAIAFGKNLDSGQPVTPDTVLQYLQEMREVFRAAGAWLKTNPLVGRTRLESYDTRVMEAPYAGAEGLRGAADRRAGERPGEGLRVAEGPAAAAVPARPVVGRERARRARVPGEGIRQGPPRGPGIEADTGGAPGRAREAAGEAARPLRDLRPARPRGNPPGTAGEPRAPEPGIPRPRGARGLIEDAPTTDNDNVPRFARNLPAERRHERATEPVFFSTVDRVLASAKQRLWKPSQLLKWLQNQPNIKPEELEWRGLTDILENWGEGPGSPPVDLATFVDTIKTDLYIHEIRKIGAPLGGQLSVPAPTGKLIPGAVRTTAEILPSVSYARYQQPGPLELSSAGEPKYYELLITLPASARHPGMYQSPHFNSIANILCWIRFSERLSPDGKRMLFIEELQSDWHQSAQKLRRDLADRIAEDKGISRAAAISKVPKNVGYAGLVYGTHPLSPWVNADTTYEWRKVKRAPAVGGESLDVWAAYYEADEGAGGVIHKLIRELPPTEYGLMLRDRVKDAIAQAPPGRALAWVDDAPVPRKQLGLVKASYQQTVDRRFPEWEREMGEKILGDAERQIFSLRRLAGDVPEGLYWDALTERQMGLMEQIEEARGNADQLRAALNFAAVSGFAVPDAPLKDNAWAGMALKRMVAWAAAAGFERVGWTTGLQQVNMWTTATRAVVDRIEYEPVGAGDQSAIEVTASKEGRIIIQEQFRSSTLMSINKIDDGARRRHFSLAELVGAENADTIVRGVKDIQAKEAAAPVPVSREQAEALITKARGVSPEKYADEYPRVKLRVLMSSDVVLGQRTIDSWMTSLARVGVYPEFDTAGWLHLKADFELQNTMEVPRGAELATFEVMEQSDYGRAGGDDEPFRFSEGGLFYLDPVAGGMQYGGLTSVNRVGETERGQLDTAVYMMNFWHEDVRVLEAPDRPTAFAVAEALQTAFVDPLDGSFQTLDPGVLETFYVDEVPSDQASRGRRYVIFENDHAIAFFMKREQADLALAAIKDVNARLLAGPPPGAEDQRRPAWRPAVRVWSLGQLRRAFGVATEIDGVLHVDEWFDEEGNPRAVAYEMRELDMVLPSLAALNALPEGVELFSPRAEGTKGRIEGDDLTVGGRGMLTFYDEVMENLANKLYKKYGTEVKPGKLRTRKRVVGAVAVREIATPQVRIASMVDGVAVILENLSPGTHLAELEHSDSAEGLRTALREIFPNGEPIPEDELSAWDYVEEEEGLWAVINQRGARVLDVRSDSDASRSLRAIEHVNRILIQGLEEAGGAPVGPEYDIHTMDITPKLKEGIAQGQPLFARQPMNQEINAPKFVDGAPGWFVPTENPIHRLRSLVQDKFLRVKVIQKSLAEAGAEITDDLDVYLLEELYYGKVAHDIERYQAEYVDPLVDAIARTGVAMEDLNAFLYARHAPERNAYLQDIWINRKRARLEREIAELKKLGRPTDRAKLEAKLADLARVNQMEVEKRVPHSGMTNEEAQRVLDDLQARGLVSFDRSYAEMQPAGEVPLVNFTGTLADLARLVDNITSEKMRAIEESGLETAETVERTQQRYRYYVPLKGYEVEGDLEELLGPWHTYQGQGFDVRGTELDKALGRHKKATNEIVSQAILDGQTLIIRRRKNEVGEALLKLAERNPNPKLWEINKVVEKAIYDPELGEAKKIEDAWAKYAPWVLSVKREGVEWYMTLKDARLASAMKNLGVNSGGAVVKAIATVNRYLANVNTAWNPEFVISNFVRDLQTAGVNLSDEETKNLLGDVLRNVLPAIRGIYAVKQKTMPGIGRPLKPNAFSTHYEEYRKSGAAIGFFGLVDVEQMAEDLMRDINRNAAGMGPATRRTLHSLQTLVENANSAVENGIRLSTFVAAKKAGMSEARAASLARNLTVNFNRKGELGWLNGLYLFFNAGVQGSARLMGAMVKSPRVRRVMGAIITTSMGLAMWNRAMSGEDDDSGENRWDLVPDYVKERNVVIYYAPGRYLMLPAPYGYNVGWVLGITAERFLQKTTDRAAAAAGVEKPAWMRSAGGYTTMEAALNVVDALVGAFNPLGDAKLATIHGTLRTLAPTFIDPLIDLGMNRNFAGIPLRPEQPAYQPEVPRSELYFKTVSRPLRVLARQLNEWAGGNEFEPGTIGGFNVSASPEDLEYVLQTATGGAGHLLQLASDMILNVLTARPTAKSKVPFIRRVIGENDDRSVPHLYYANRERLGQAEKAYEGLTGKEQEHWARKRAWMIPLFDVYKQADEAIGIARKEGRDEFVVLQMKTANRMYREAEEGQ